MGVWGRGWVASLTLGGGREQLVLWYFFDMVELAQTAPPGCKQSTWEAEVQQEGALHVPTS